MGKSKRIIVCAFTLAMLLCSCDGTDLASQDVQGDDLYLSISGASSIDKSQDGYYIAANGLVFYYAPEQKEAIPLCNKADCAHGADDFSNAYYCNAWCDSGYITFWEDSIYYIGRDGVSTGLYKMQADGSGSEKITDLYTYEDSYGGVNIGYLNYIYGNGYCYYSHAAYDEEGAYRLYLMELALKRDAKPEVLMEIPCENQVVDVVNMSVSSHWVTCVCLDENGNYMAYVIDSDSKEVKLKLENTLRVCVKDDVLYYLVQGEGIYRRSIGDSKGECLIPETTKNLMLGIDDDYIYLDWSRSAGIDDDSAKTAFLDIYTYEGEKVARLDTAFIDDVLSRAYMASDSSFVFLGEAQSYYSDIYLLEKAQLTNSSPDWQTISLSQWRPEQKQ